MTPVDEAKIYVRRIQSEPPPFSQGTREANRHAIVLADEVLRLELVVQKLERRIADPDQEYLIIAENFRGHIHVRNISAAGITDEEVASAIRELGSPVRILSIPIVEIKVG